MAKKQIRNKFRDRFADYYLMNREVTKEADERYKKEREAGEKRAWTRSEKIMLAITLMALVLLAVKYIIL
ncbi:MAG: hypothetical protein WCX60_04955 [Anaerovoracaceae bacterium]